MFVVARVAVGLDEEVLLEVVDGVVVDVDGDVTVVVVVVTGVVTVTGEEVTGVDGTLTVTVVSGTTGSKIAFTGVVTALTTG